MEALRCKSFSEHTRGAVLLLQIKHDDLKDAAHVFVEELVAGKEWIADHKEEQVGLSLVRKKK